MRNDCTKCVCVVGARKGSKRLPGKNRVPINGKPLYQYTIETAIDSGILPNIKNFILPTHMAMS